MNTINFKITNQTNKTALEVLLGYPVELNKISIDYTITSDTSGALKCILFNYVVHVKVHKDTMLSKYILEFEGSSKSFSVLSSKIPTKRIARIALHMILKTLHRPLPRQASKARIRKEKLLTEKLLLANLKLKPAMQQEYFRRLKCTED